MKRLLIILMGIMLIVLSFGMLVVGGMIFDTSKKQTIETFFFQRANLSEERIGKPIPVEELELNENRILEMLTDKFITEYFYVIPDEKNVSARIKGATGLENLVSPTVFNDWAQNVGPKLAEMAKEGMLRTARLVDMQKQKNSEQWWELKYELITWDTPNNLTQEPVLTQGSMYVRLRYEPGWKPDAFDETQEMDIVTHLEQGGDPSYIFKFKIENIE